MRFIFAFILCALTSAVHAQETPEPLAAFAQAEMQAAGAPGLAYTVVKDGHAATYAHGTALLGSGDPVTPDTPFVIGSVSKSFTAMAVMTLVEAGQVDLDAPISDYLGGFRGRPSGEITIRQLLSHTSGYATRQGNETHVDRRRGDDELARQVNRIAQWSPRRAPGEGWEYSNANYLILGALIEKVSGLDYADYMDTHILRPIGMNHSFISDGQRHEQMATGHQPWFGTKRALKDRRTNRVTAPAGGLVASASDLGLYLAVMVNGQDDIIRAETKALMLQPANDASPFYGLGWFIDKSNGTAYHSGLSPGVETLALLSPQKREAAAVLVNANSGMGFGVNTGLLNGISAKALGLDYENDENIWGTRSFYLTFLLLPILFFVAILRAGFRPDGLRAKSGLGGALSLWFPCFAAAGLAWLSLQLIPGLFGVPLKTLSLYQPDCALLLVATAVMGVIWALFRLAIFYSGRSHAKTAN